jgi:glucose-1-phosphate thymidylyltransferase
VAVVGVIPAAGYATRLQPLECSKEVFRVGGRPVMDYLVERMKAAPCTELRVVTRPEKADVIANARLHGATVIEARPATLADSVLAGIEGLARHDVVLLGFPDSLWEPVDGYRPVLELLRAGDWDVALGLFRDDTELRRYEPVVLRRDGVTVERIEFKPDSPSSDWLWGCAATTAGVVRGLDGEEPGIYFDALARQGRVGAVRLSEDYLDMGTPDSLQLALHR